MRIPGSVGGGAATLTVFDPATREQQTDCTGHTERVFAVAFSPDGKMLASAAGDPNPFHLVIELKLWDADTGASRANDEDPRLKRLEAQIDALTQQLKALGRDRGEP